MAPKAKSKSTSKSKAKSKSKSKSKAKSMGKKASPKKKAASPKKGAGPTANPNSYVLMMAHKGQLRFASLDENGRVVAYKSPSAEYAAQRALDRRIVPAMGATMFVIKRKKSDGTGRGAGRRMTLFIYRTKDGVPVRVPVQTKRGPAEYVSARSDKLLEYILGAVNRF